MCCSFCLRGVLTMSSMELIQLNITDKLSGSLLRRMGGWRATRKKYNLCGRTLAFQCPSMAYSLFHIRHTPLVRLISLLRFNVVFNTATSVFRCANVLTRRLGDLPTIL